MTAPVICQNCGRPFMRNAPGNTDEMDCSRICSVNSRKRRKALGLRGPEVHVELRRVHHVQPVPLIGRRWLMAVWPPYRRRVERDSRLVWFDPADIGKSVGTGRTRVWLHSPPERCQLCGKPVPKSTRASRTNSGLVYCSPEHLQAARPLREPLPIACPRPDKRGRYATREEAEQADPVRVAGIEKFHAYQCDCAWWHLGNARDWGNTIGARATIRHWGAS